MNFAGAVRGSISLSGALQNLQDQAETELSRKLFQNEIVALTNKFKLNDLLIKCKQVITLRLKPYV